MAPPVRLPPSLINTIGYRLRLNFSRQFQQRMAAGTRGVTNGIAAAAEVFANNLGDPADMYRIHSDVAHEAMVAVLEDYDAKVTDRPGAPPSYRIGTRYSGGALRRALSSPSMAVPTAEGINYVDQDLLNQEARHWMRLNFGAGERGSENRPGAFPLMYDQRVVYTLQFRAGPRPGFSMPHGWFYGPNGEMVGADAGRRGLHAFGPWRKPLLYPTKGIRGRQFLDAGLEVMATELPGRYHQQFDLWFAAGTEAGRRYFAAHRKVTPQPFRPR